jgi:hypothetical protein
MHCYCPKSFVDGQPVEKQLNSYKFATSSSAADEDTFLFVVNIVISNLFYEIMKMPILAFTGTFLYMCNLSISRKII